MYKSYTENSIKMATTMEYRYLGNSGLKVSSLCLGTMTFGASDKAFAEFFNSARQCNEELSHRMMDKFAELGGNFLDTADIYAFGNSEKIIGTWLKKQKREKFVLATKANFQTEFDNVNYLGLSRRHLTESCEASLKRLQTDYIDLYQAHQWDNGTPIEETLRTYDDLIRCGKIRYFGFSNVCGWQMQKIVDTAKHLGLSPCISLQQQYSLLERSNEYEAFMVCRNEGIGVLPWSPLKSGLLTGKYKKDVVPDEKQNRMGIIKKMESKVNLPDWSNYQNNEAYWDLIETMKTIAGNHGKSVAQVALRWCLQKDIVSSVIIGATTMEQLEDNMGAAVGWQLTEEEMSKLDGLSLPEATYPYEQLFQAGFFTAGRYNMFNRDSLKI